MQKSQELSRKSPFFGLLERAEEIKIREIPAHQSENFTQSVESLLDGIELKDSQKDHAFLVYVRSTPEQKVEEVSQKFQEELPREFLIENARILVAGNDHLLARNIYSFLLKKNIRDLPALKGLGICFLKLGESQSAKKCFRALFELYKLEEALAWLGFCSLAEGDEKTASNYFLQVSQPQQLPEDVRFDYFKERGNAHTRINLFEDAFTSYSEALKIKENSDTVYVNLGTLELQRKRFESAHSHFTKAVFLNPRNAKAFCGLGLVAIELGQTVFAKQQFEKALEQDSQHGVALQQLIRLAEQDGTMGAIKLRLQNYLLKDPSNAEFRYWLAACHIKESNFRAAEKEIDQVLSEHPNHPKSKTLKEEILAIAYRQGATR